jgi:hypothetical protein
MFETGFPIEVPALIVPWHINEHVLVQLLGKRLRHVTHGYYTTACTALAGLQIQLGFHFEPRRDGILREFEVFRGVSHDLQQSYSEFQHHLVRLLGKPATTGSDGGTGFDSHEWRGVGYRVVHLVKDRFGPEEHVRVQFIAAA